MKYGKRKGGRINIIYVYCSKQIYIMSTKPLTTDELTKQIIDKINHLKTKTDTHAKILKALEENKTDSINLINSSILSEVEKKELIDSANKILEIQEKLVNANKAAESIIIQITETNKSLEEKHKEVQKEIEKKTQSLDELTTTYDKAYNDYNNIIVKHGKELADLNKIKTESDALLQTKTQECEKSLQSILNALQDEVVDTQVNVNLHEEGNTGGKYHYNKYKTIQIKSKKNKKNKKNTNNMKNTKNSRNTRNTRNTKNTKNTKNTRKQRKMRNKGKK